MYNLVIYTIQTITILSQQNKRDIGTFKEHNIQQTIYINCCQWFKKSDFETKPPSNKRRPYINAASETLKI